MAAPEFSPILDSDIALGTGIRRTFGVKTKDSLDNLNFRIKGLEGPARFFTHFNENLASLNLSLPLSLAEGSVFEPTGSPPFINLTPSGIIGTGGPSDTSSSAYAGEKRVSFSEVSMIGQQINSAFGSWRKFIYYRPFLPDRTTLPIIFGCRGRWADTRVDLLGFVERTDQAPIVGMKVWESNSLSPDSAVGAGAWLQKGGTGLWRFRMRNSAGVDTIGVNTFARASNNTDFEVKIEFTTDPTNRVIMSCDNGDGAGLIVRETFLDNLPFNSILFAQLGMQVPGLGPAKARCSFDWLEYSAGDVLDTNP